MKIEGQAIFKEAPMAQGSKPRVQQAGQQADSMKKRASDPVPASYGKSLGKAARTINEFMNLSNYHVEFQVQEKPDQLQVRVVNSDTGDVVREIPPDYMLKIAEQIKDRMQRPAGLLLDQQV